MYVRLCLGRATGYNTCSNDSYYKEEGRAFTDQDYGQTRETKNNKQERDNKRKG